MYQLSLWPHCVLWGRVSQPLAKLSKSHEQWAGLHIVRLQPCHQLAIVLCYPCSRCEASVNISRFFNSI